MINTSSDPALSPPVASRREIQVAFGTFLGCLILLLCLVPYNLGFEGIPRPILGMAHRIWTKMPDWEHGMLVPFITAGLIYWRWEELKKVPLQGDNRAWPALLLAVLAYWSGFLTDYAAAGFLAAQILIGALIWWLFGLPLFRALLFPYGFLIFMWPFTFLESSVAYPLRGIMADLSYYFLNAVGIHCLKLGSSLVSAPDFNQHLPQGAKFAVDIADACSGIRSLFALTMITALYAHLMLRRPWQQWILFLCAAPFAVLGNFARIVILTFGTLLFGNEFAIGSEEEPSSFHLGAGFFVYVVALFAMYHLSIFLQSRDTRPPTSLS